MTAASLPLQRRQSGRLLILLLLLGGTLGVICHQGFLPYQAFFANDAALGLLRESSARLPGTFAGFWADFWWLGGAIPSSSPSLSTLLLWALSPELYLKIYPPLTMLFLGFCVWFFFRQLRFAPLTCVIAGLGAGLNMHFFSNACWGLGTWCVSTGMVFVALGIVVSPCIRQLWIKAALAGLAVGMVVMEGFDVGAIYSIYIGLFILFFFLTNETTPSAGLKKALGVEIAVIAFALFVSASTLYTLVGTQITGTTNGGVNSEDKAYHWGFTTQWSIPKLESFRVIIPGLFGYRMAEFMTSTNKESAYWGSVAEDPHIQLLESGGPETRRAAAKSLGLSPEVQDKMASTNPSDQALQENILGQVKGQLQRRHSGSGEYAGVLVCLLAIFGIATGARKTGSPFSANERRAVWFWSGAAVFSLLAAWGRYGAVYQVIYQLPFLSNIRNPMKFMHPLNVSLILLSGFGLEALYRSYLQPANPQVGKFEKRWNIGMVVAVVLLAIGLLVLNSSQPDLVKHLVNNGFDEDLAPRIAKFCVNEVGLFLLFFGLAALTLRFILSGKWTGQKAIWAWSFLSAIMIVDLARTDVPWIRYFNYREKYSMNPVVDFLRHEPWEHRVVARFAPIPAPYELVPGVDTGTPDNNVGALCHWWLENDFPYNDIQDLELDQAPRMPVLDSSYIGAFHVSGPADLSVAAVQWAQTNSPQNPLQRWVIGCGPAARLWRLTNTRYIFASANFTAVANQFVDPPNSFRTVMRLTMDYKPGIKLPEDAGDMTVNINSNGPLALIEYTRVLPRAKLYSDWQMMDDDAALKTLNSPHFDPVKTVLVATNTPAPPPSGGDPGAVAITRYRAKDIQLHAEAKAPAILLLNDRTGDFWNVWVDGKPAPLLRCNYIMRGVFLTPGEHTIQFRYLAPLKFLCISVAGLAIGIILTGFVLYDHRRRSSKQSTNR